MSWIFSFGIIKMQHTTFHSIKNIVKYSIRQSFSNKERDQFFKFIASATVLPTVHKNVAENWEKEQIIFCSRLCTHPCLKSVNFLRQVFVVAFRHSSIFIPLYLFLYIYSHILLSSYLQSKVDKYIYVKLFMNFPWFLI